MNEKGIIIDKLNTLFFILRHYNNNYIYNERNKAICFTNKYNCTAIIHKSFKTEVVAFDLIEDNSYNIHISKEKAIHIYLV